MKKDRFVGIVLVFTIVGCGASQTKKQELKLQREDTIQQFTQHVGVHGLSKQKDSVPLSGFATTYYDATADYCDRVHCRIAIDFPKPPVIHSDAITKWLVENMLNSFTGPAKRKNTGWQYDGDIRDHKGICKFASDVFFAIVKKEYETNDEEFPSALFSTLVLKVNVNNGRFITYQQYTNSYYGGAHDYQTERLITFDPVHRKEIDFDFLFRNECKEKLLDLLLEFAKCSPKYQEWDPDIRSCVTVKGDDNKPTGELRFPQPGLSDEGVVFSFQPYEISCFTAGTFHFMIPYERLRPFLTENAKWCLRQIVM